MDRVDLLAINLGCAAGSLLSVYLGLPLEAKFESIRAWDLIVERFEKRLAGWTANYLSKGDCLTLIKSTLSSLPVYDVPFSYTMFVAKHIEVIERNFLWRGCEREYISSPTLGFH